MDDIRLLTHIYKDLHVSAHWNDLIDFYEKVDSSNERFTSSLQITCPPYCGTCCEHFIPELTPTEASLIASYLIHIKKDVSIISSIDPLYRGTQCPLYKKEDPYHCQIYRVRSHLCRSFGSSPSTDKFDEPLFRKCKYNNLEDQKSLITSDEIHLQVENVLTMQEASMSLSSLIVDSSRESLPQALYKALQHLTLISTYAKGNTDESFITPDPSSPVAV